MTETRAVLLVYSTSHAIRAEHVLNQAGILCKLIPVPRHLSSDCGICVRIARRDVGATQRAMDEAGAEYKEIRDL